MSGSRGSEHRFLLVGHVHQFEPSSAAGTETMENRGRTGPLVVDGDSFQCGLVVTTASVAPVTRLLPCGFSLGIPVRIGTR
ncbi:hypothetical protein [Haladaptatus sp. CMAA 1911]|uniref:hypothetical protein n=1 Tax=unclassified Haladaptatus TaxID=2622732 RepID=UPI003754938E